jgi:hypothetical protein
MKIRVVWNDVSTELRVEQADNRECEDREGSQDKGSDFGFCAH